MEAGSGKTLYVHIGLHKTGSTSLQNFLQLNEATLLAGGLYIPRSGRHQRELTAPTIIHSHLSWQYLGRPLFDPAAAWSCRGSGRDRDHHDSPPFPTVR